MRVHPSDYAVSTQGVSGSRRRGTDRSVDLDCSAQTGCAGSSRIAGRADGDRAGSYRGARCTIGWWIRSVGASGWSIRPAATVVSVALNRTPEPRPEPVVLQRFQGGQVSRGWVAYPARGAGSSQCHEADGYGCVVRVVTDIVGRARAEQDRNCVENLVVAL